MTLSRNNPGGTVARPQRPNGDAKKSVPGRGGFFGMMRPAASPASGGTRPGVLSGFRARFSGVNEWLRSIMSELRKVTWPSREVTRNLTIIVIAVSSAVGALLGALDYLFKILFEQLLR